MPAHRKATTSPSVASKVSVLLDFRPLRTCRGMASRLDWYLECVVHLHRPNRPAVDLDAIGGTTYLRANRLVGHFQCCPHLESRYLLMVWAAPFHNVRGVTQLILSDQNVPYPQEP